MQFTQTYGDSLPGPMRVAFAGDDGTNEGSWELRQAAGSCSSGIGYGDGQSGDRPWWACALWAMAQVGMGLNWLLESTALLY